MIDYKGINKGDILYESSYGYTIEVRVITDPVYVEVPEDERTAECDTWRVSFKAESAGREIDYRISPIGLAYNVGRLYESPAYAGKIMKLDGTVEDYNPLKF